MLLCVVVLLCVFGNYDASSTLSLELVVVVLVGSAIRGKANGAKLRYVNSKNSRTIGGKTTQCTVTTNNT